jgi:hypothetical protein
MKTLASFWKNSVASYTAAQNAAAIANGTIIPQPAPVDSSGNNALLAAPSVKTYLNPISPEPVFITPSFTPTGQIATTDPANVLTDAATSLGLIQPAAPSVGSDTIVICIAGGIALIGILALIFKH